MTAPVITVVTVVKNDKQGLLRTLASLSQQTRGAWDHLIVDGASVDGTAELAGDLPAWSRMRSELDDGLYDAMNKAIAFAGGRVITYLNAGDTYVRSGFLIDVADSFLRDGWEWAYARARPVDVRGAPYRRAIGIAPYSVPKHAYVIAAVSHQATFMKADLLNRLGGFREEYHPNADYDLLLRAGRTSTPHVWGGIEVNYAVGGISEAHMLSAIMIKHHIRCDVFDLHGFLAAADLGYAACQACVIYGRRYLKRFILAAGGQPLITKWVR